MDTRLSIKSIEVPILPWPEDPDEDAARNEVRICEKSVDDYAKGKTILSENAKPAYSLVWGQWSNVMCQKVETSPSFLIIYQNGDAIKSLKIIKNIAYNYLVQKYIPQSLYEAKKKFYAWHQLCHQSTQTYFKYFQHQVEDIDDINWSIGYDPILLNKIAKSLNEAIETLSENEWKW